MHHPVRSAVSGFAALAALALVAACTPQPIPAENPPPAADACENVDCGPHGHCAAVKAKAECVCDVGFTSSGLACIPVTPCDPDPCKATGKTCTATGGAAICACPAGYIDQANGCMAPGPCQPNPCTGAHQTVCSNNNGTAACSCDPGYSLKNNACVQDAMSDCGKAHSGGMNEDSFEADECPTLAKSYVIASTTTPQMRSIAPAGDEDWVGIVPALGHVISVDITSSTVPLYLDAFAPESGVAFASNHLGGAAPQLRFSTFTAGGVYIRVKAVLPSDTGTYTLAITDIGPDDFAGTAADATTLSYDIFKKAEFKGAIDFGADEDLVKVPALQGHSYRFDLDATSASNITVDVLDLDWKTVRKTLDKSLPASSTHVAHTTANGAFLLRAKGVGGATGKFQVNVTDLGVDDHGDSLADADSAAPSALASNGQFERNDDLDVFTFQVKADKIYRFMCTEGAWGCVMALRDSMGNVLASQPSTNSSVRALSVKATAAGTWNISLQPYSTSSGSGAYTWQLEEFDKDDFGDSAAMATALTLGTNISGVLELSGDHDFFSVVTTRTHLYKVTCNSPSNSGLCNFTVRDPGGAPVATATSSTTFNSANGGVYTIDVTGFAQGFTGHYDLVVTDQGGDDYGDTVATATTVTLGQTVTGSIDFNSDQDVFKFDAVIGHVFRVHCTSPRYDLCYMTVTDAAGSPIATSSWGTTGDVAILAQATSYYVAVKSAYTTSTGTYGITVTDAGLDDIGDDPAHATPLTVGAPQNGNTQYTGDKDVLSFAGLKDHIYKVTCASTPPTNGLCQVTITDAVYTRVASSSGTSSTVTYFRATTAQTYYATVQSAATGYYGAWQLNVVDDGVDDYGDTPAGAGSIMLGSPVSGMLEPEGDVDVMGFTATANHVYTVSCSSPSSSSCLLTVRDVNTATLVTNTKAGTSAQVQFKASTATKVTVEVKSQSFAGVTSYTLQITDVGADDYGDTPLQASPITSGGATVSGVIEWPDDKDTFSFSGVADKVYTVRCNSTAANVCLVTVRDPQGTAIASGYPSGGGSSTAFKSKLAGTYTIEVGSYTGSSSSTGGYTGTYTVALTETIDDYGDDSTTATALSLGTVINGKFEYSRDEDWFKVQLTANTAYTISTTGSTVLIDLYQPDGVTAIGSWTINNRTFTPTTSGTYYVRLWYSSTGTYTAKIQ